MTRFDGWITGAIVAATFAIAAPASAQWASFVNETATRLPVPPNTAALSTADLKEKDYAWGDVDGDGDIDLVCVRKQPFTSEGRDPNVLFMNEGIAEGHALNGVLVDRTSQYAATALGGATLVWDDPQRPGGAMPDQGFLTWTNDRDVVLADVNNDGWLDIITATTLSDNENIPGNDDAPKWIGHPRIYMNLKEVAGVWQGFQYEPNRIPQMHATIQPRFCSVAAGDVTGDGYADLYFGDYDSGPPEPYDYNNKLLINQGASNPGFFTDSGNTRMTANPGLLSAFGAASVIADINGDGRNDVVKQTSLNEPLHIAVQHNEPNLKHPPGVFPDGGYKIVDQQAPYFVSAGDLNNDGRLDLVITDDSDDHYWLNTGNASNGTANFPTSYLFAFSDGGFDDGFGSQSVIADLDNDGWKDVLISDVDVDIFGCERRLHLYHNLGNAPIVTLKEETVAGLTNYDDMNGTHNVAVFDINADGWLDLVLGRCSGTAVWMNAGISFSEGPETITPDTATSVAFDIVQRGAVHVPGSLKIHISQNGGPFIQQNLSVVDSDTYSATFPATPCGQVLRFYFSGQLKTVGGTQVHSFTHPSNGATGAFGALSGFGWTLASLDEIEGDVSGWTTAISANSGAWAAADPNGTISGGFLAAPEDDATPAPGVKAFVTQNGPPGGPAGGADIDNGFVRLTSPVINLAGTNATITYARWFFGAVGEGNSLVTEVSNNNGASWVLVDTVNSSITSGGATVWQEHAFVVGEYVSPTAQVRVRFTATDDFPADIVEAGIDDFRVETLLCSAPCVADISGDGSVDVNDLLALIGAWGSAGGPADLNGDNAVNVNDLLILIGAWGPCV